MSSSYDHSRLDRNLKTSLLLNTCFMLFEFIVGLLTGSLALLSDAGHNLTDSLSLVIAIGGQKMAKREANIEHSYGYGRATILAALFNGIILSLLALYIFYEAYQRILSPKPVTGEAIIIVAIVGIIINGGIALLLKKDKDDLNIKSAFVNMALDALALVGTLLAGILILITKQPIFDPLIGFLIGILLIHGAWGVAKDAIHILLEGAPEGIDFEKIKQVICSAPKVKNVDDLHIWAISSKYAALSCHIVIEDCDVKESSEIVKTIKDELHTKFNISHATIEPELVECPPDK